MNILITGISGSLGWAFAKLLAGKHHIIGYDNSEWAIAELQKELPGIELHLEDFSEWKYDQNPVDAVIHCAAYKHVNLGEGNVNSFIDNNIIKTRKLFAEAYKNNADILFISTDKAVEPCNLYGYTKAIGEYLARTYGGYIARCGNFLSSSGSVIPAWEQAIEKGRPLPITNPEMIRYVVYTDEAAKEIWDEFEEMIGGYAPKRLIIPNCKKVTVLDLAQMVLKLKGQKPTYPVEVIGERPGEKFEEKLRWDDEV